MCCADSSLEKKDLALGGVTGWDFPRKCHDYDELKEWSVRWRTNNMTGMSDGPGHS